MKELEIKELDEILEEFVSDKIEVGEAIDYNSIESFLKPYIEKKAILGFDIYQYSQFPSLQQTLIPHLFKELYTMTINNCIGNEDFFFEYKVNADFEKNFIDTGDGGFQIFETPIEALIFAIYFQANIARYNTGNKLLFNLYHVIGEINLRYSLTYGNIYSYKENFYGTAIINCARIMSKDKLNRFLIDSNSITWFNTEINSIETCLSFEPASDFPTIPIFKSKFNVATYKSKIFGIEDNRIKCLDVLKIGEIKSKLDTLSIFNAHMQVELFSDGKDFKKYRITLGNLNSSDLTE